VGGNARGLGMSANQPTWFGQPRGLTILFLTQMWEIFSYYGMRTLLVYYMTKQLLIGQEKASLIYGTYTAMAYFTPILGGVIADRWLGRRRAVIIGASIMAAGHFMMAFEPSFYLALATIALGNGLFVPSLPSQINDLYRSDDPRRSWAYNVYYVGINLGGFLAPLICGTLGELYGWHWGFGAAGVGMLAGLVIYILGGRYLPDQAPVAHKAAPASTSILNHRSTLVLLLAIGLAVTVFRAAYEQIGNTVALWSDVGIDRKPRPGARSHRCGKWRSVR
jgi:proton-dependent oligopeptide transporter, POT family